MARTATLRAVPRTLFALAVALWLPASSEAALRYVRQGATGSGSGVDWTNACPGFVGACAVSALVRGDVYYVADGSYGTLILDRPAAGTAIIAFRKAIAADHGSDVGWQPTFGDGQAVFGDLIFVTDYWAIDGATRNEAAWNDGASYGFRADAVSGHRLNFGRCGDYVTVQYVDIDGGFTGVGSALYSPIYLGGFGGGSQACEGWTIRRNYVHAAGVTQLAGALSTLIEHNYFGPIWGKEIIRGQVSTRATTVRYNVFHNGCRDDHSPGTGCTAEIAFFGNQGDTPDFEGVSVHGNVVRKTIRQHKTDATFMFEASDCKVFNNTVYDDASSGQGMFRCAPGAGGEIRNNIVIAPNGLFSGCLAATCDNNSTYTTAAPVVNVALGDFRLTAPLPGVVLPSQFGLDLAGVTRGSDGTWDRGAFEYGVGSPPPPPPPPGSGPLSVTLTQTTFRPSDTLVATVQAAAGVVAGPVDAFVVVRTGDGAFLSLQLDGRLVPGLVPLARNIQLPTVSVPFAFPLAGAPLGGYTWMAAVTAPGTLTLLSPVSSAAFTIAP